jgi:hypothetical protein
MAQVVECLPSKSKALSSKPSTAPLLPQKKYENKLAGYSGAHL